MVACGEKELLDRVLRSLSGEFNNLRLIEVKSVRGFVLIRCSHLQLQALKERLASLGIKVVGVSGTIKAAARKFVKK